MSSSEAKGEGETTPMDEVAKEEEAAEQGQEKHNVEREEEGRDGREQEEEKKDKGKERLKNNNNEEEEEATEARMDEEGKEEQPEMDGEEEHRQQQLKEIAKRDQERLRDLRKRQKAILEEARKQQNAEVESKEQKASTDRFKYLLQQSEIFTHFVKGQATSVKKEERGGRGASSTRRGRKTEKEEDEEILEEALEEEEAPPTGTRLTASPSWITGGTMRDYQLHGLNWLIKLYENGINGILADEMGLGKTLQTISLLGFLKNERGLGGPHLIITPKSTLQNWINEFRRWCPSLAVFKFHGSKDERAKLKEEALVAGKFDCVVTTYEIAIMEKAALRKFSWRYLIIDEAHRIKNEQSVLSKIVRMYSSQYRLLLTGTPLQNNLHELWALLNFLLPDVFGSAEDFDSWFNLGEMGGNNQNDMVEKLHKVLRPFLLRRLKSDVERNLPPKVETKLFVGMSAMQREWYTKILSKDIEAINGIVGGKAGQMRLLNIVMQLRKACNHPYLFDGAEPGPPYTNGEHLVTNSGKMVVLDKLLPRLKQQGSRVLIFSQMTRLLDILEDYLVMRDYEYRRIDGSTSGEERGQYIDEFNEPDSSIFIFLLSTRAGGLGINLATADTVILYDSDWNPQVDLQAQDRAHRIGQTKQVNVYRFVTEDAIEEKVVERAEAKLHLDALVIRQGQLVEKHKALDKEELLAMIRFGADKIFKSKGSTITDEDIDLIISKGAKRTESLNEKLSNNSQSLLNFSSGDSEFGSVYQFDGVDYSALHSKKKRQLSWIKLPARTRKQNYSVDNYYREVMRTTPAKKPTLPRPPKQPVIHDFQFYPPRVSELLEKETAAFRARLEYKKNKALEGHSGRASAAAEEGEEEQEQEEEKEPDFGDLTEEERAEKDELLTQGFADWNRRDFQSFVKACERFGRRDLEAIAQAVESKSLQQVTAYSKAFWKYGPTMLKDWERVKTNIEKGEAKIHRREEMVQALRSKVSRYKNPWTQLKIAYTNKTKAYTPEEDRFLICMTDQLGYGNWEQLKMEIRKSWLFRFDWFFKSRTPIELSRRCDALIRMIEKENQELEEQQRRKRQKQPNKGTKRSSAGSSSSADKKSSTNASNKRRKVATQDKKKSAK
ncbi:ISWI chromatin-remodeling complex ATPase CHR11 [Balamuthia mandrillaris]